MQDDNNGEIADRILTWIETDSGSSIVRTETECIWTDQNEYSIDAAVALVAHLVVSWRPQSACILRALNDQPRNTNQLSNDLDLNYKTVQHHLEVLEESNIVTTEGDNYGQMCFLSDRMMNNPDIMEDVAEQAGVDDDS